MRAMDLYPLKLKPSLHVKVWGGRRFATVLNKPLPTAGPYGEAWELHDSSIVCNGPPAGMARAGMSLAGKSLAGKSLAELTAAYGARLIGAGNDPRAGFPLLAKFIDAEEWLSIQVHPNDEQALALEGEPRGKSEAWVVIHADAGARLIAGARAGITRADFAEAMRNDRLESLLRYVEVGAGDSIAMPANTIHALGPGLLIYEIQQSSDTTYRLYDWGRAGLNGKPRPLHIDKGLQVANLSLTPQVTGAERDLIVDEKYFMTWRHRLCAERLVINTQGRFQALSCLDGEIALSAADDNEPITLAKGETGLIPACFESFALSGAGTVLRSCQRNSH